MQKSKKRNLKESLEIAVFVVPALVLFAMFVIYPLIPEIKISLQNHNGMTSKEFVGLKNYITVLTSASFKKAQWNTILTVAINLLIGLPISLIFALLMDRVSPKVRTFFKITSVFPAVLSATVIGKMWVAIYEPQWGLVNTILDAIGLDSLTKIWLGNVDTAMVCIIIAYFWQFLGLNGLQFYTGIKAIPKTYYEAAEIDGAGFWTASFKITVPLLQDVMKYVITTSTMGSLAMFSYVSVMTQGGPGFSTRTLTYEMYYRAFTASKFGEGCAVAIVFVAEAVVVSMIINRFVAREKIEY